MRRPAQDAVMIGRPRHFTSLTRRVAAMGLAAAALARPSASTAADALRIAAAADVRGALDALMARFTAGSLPATRPVITATYGSTGNLARQIEQGAPFDLFLAADERYARRLINAGLTGGDGLVYAIGRLSLIAPRNSALPAKHSTSRLDGLGAAVAAGQVKRFALANPEHAPYGERGREVLQSLGVWNALQGRLVLGENVAQAAQYVASGGADAGIVAASLLHLPEFAATVLAELIPSDRHTALRQRAVLIRGAKPFAAEMLAFLATPDSQAVFKAHGFDSPQ